jgi:hypothetical protein
LANADPRIKMENLGIEGKKKKKGGDMIYPHHTKKEMLFE